MKKTKLKHIIIPGILCALTMAASIWYAIRFNNARLVAPMDFSEYAFQVKDLPMLLSFLLVWLYLFYLIVLLAQAGIRQKRTVEATRTTRKLNPRLGFLGLLGFLGFAGFFTYSTDREIFPFAFFLFFGFFGFFYEGKMSGTLMDERYEENRTRARLTSMSITIKIVFLTLLVCCQGALLGSLEYTLIAILILLSSALGLCIFLSEYLLYRYDAQDRLEESED